MNDTTTSRPPSPRIVFVGAGNMASALIGGLARTCPPAT